MLQSISWSEYITAVVLLLVVYYLVIAGRYCSGDIKDILTGKRTLRFRTALPAPGKHEEEIPSESGKLTGGSEETAGNEFTDVEHLIERLKNVIADASRRNLIPQEFRQYLSMVLKEYPSLRYSPLRSSINELIISECQKYGAVTLKEEEVELLWKEAV